jgi:hypothetical protein
VNESSQQTWERGWDGHERQQRERLANLSLPEKLAWLEEAHRLVRQLKLAAPAGNPAAPSPPAGE